MTGAISARTQAAAPASVRSVLVVSSDTGLREQVAEWVEEAGYDAIMCPGPHFPGYSCVGLRGGRCPLDVVADLTILDLHPTGATLSDQTGRASLVEHYQTGGRPVLVLSDEEITDPQVAAAGAAFLERTVVRGALLASVKELLSRSPVGPVR